MDITTIGGAITQIGFPALFLVVIAWGTWQVLWKWWIPQQQKREEAEERRRDEMHTRVIKLMETM